MEDKIYSITLADGKVLSNLRLNGNNFISLNPIYEETFSGNLSKVVISDGEHEEIHNFMELVQIVKMGKEYWFVLRDLSTAELSQMRMQSDIEYISMMTGVDL